MFNEKLVAEIYIKAITGITIICKNKPVNKLLGSTKFFLISEKFIFIPKKNISTIRPKETNVPNISRIASGGDDKTAKNWLKLTLNCLLFSSKKLKIKMKNLDLERIFSVNIAKNNNKNPYWIVSQYHLILFRLNYYSMSAQFKLDQKSDADQAEQNLGNEAIKNRPNIDHLLKRIATERKQERKTSIMFIIIAVIAITVVSFLFTQV